jgi:hypothetical protein
VLSGTGHGLMISSVEGVAYHNSAVPLGVRVSLLL